MLHRWHLYRRKTEESYVMPLCPPTSSQRCWGILYLPDEEGKKRCLWVRRQVLTHWWDTHNPGSFWRNRSQLVFLCQWVLHVHNHRTVPLQRNTIRWPPGRQRGPLPDILHSTLTNLGNKQRNNEAHTIVIYSIPSATRGPCVPKHWHIGHLEVRKQENLVVLVLGMWHWPRILILFHYWK